MNFSLKYAGPTVAGIGVAMLLAGFFWWFCTLHLFSDRLRHTQAHHAPPRRRILQYHRLVVMKKFSLTLDKFFIIIDKLFFSLAGKQKANA